MQFALLILFTIQSAEQTEDADFFFFLPPLLLQDRCERSWQSRSTCIPAMDAHRGPIRRFRLSFQRKIQAPAGGRVAFILKSLPSWATLALCAHFAAPPASTPIAVTEASAAVAAAPHQRGFSHWDTPRSGGRRQLHARTRETRGHGCDGCDIPNGPGGCTWHSLKSRTLYSLFRFFVFVLLFKTYRKFPET